MKAPREQEHTFDGDLPTARKRFLRLVDLALSHGDAVLFNMQAFLLATMLHKEIGFELRDQMEAELETERRVRRIAKRGRSKAARERDVAFLQRMGIRWE
jgi:hypothetical protein